MAIKFIDNSKSNLVTPHDMGIGLAYVYTAANASLPHVMARPVIKTGAAGVLQLSKPEDGVIPLSLLDDREVWREVQLTVSYE